MRKKLIIMLSVIAVLIAASVPAFAETQVISRETEHYPDGSYAVIETVVFENTAVPFAAASTKSASRTYTFHRADGKAAWDFTLTGTFTYNGTTAKATKAATSYKVYISGWTCTKNSSVSGAVAKGTGKFTYKSGSTKTVSLCLKCSANGTITAA